MAKKAFRTHTCNRCCTSWDSQVVYSDTSQNLSGEATEYCPFCNKRADYSTPVYMASATGLTQIRVNAITFKLVQILETREWCIRVYFTITPERKQHIPDRDYYCTDLEDAVGTMKAIAREELNKIIKVIRAAQN